MGYATGAVKMLAIAPKPGQPAVPPTVENALSKKYPIARSLQVYTLGEPVGATKKYIEWILSDAGQRVLADSGYVPLSPSERAK
jgi:phosphate transport system substrate-binding protein